MAFNPLATFHKNKRFWMAVILGICMVSFIFCTGIKGDMADKLIALVGGGRSGPAIVTIDGRSISDRDLSDLKMQRNLANTFMRVCADIANKNLAKYFFDERNRQVTDKDAEARQKNMALLTSIRAVIDQRRAKPRYFDIGTKFDDLVEFKLWQAEADRLGIYLEPEHINFLFNMEFFGERLMHDLILRPGDISFAQMQAKRDIHRDATDAFIRRAIGEEFRVRIAQYVLLKAQPYSSLPMFGRKPGERGTFVLKFSDPAVPDETRAPLTMAQLFDIYKAKRSEFEVTLLPIKIEDFIARVKEEPTEDEKRAFFEAHKGKSYDPASDGWAMEIPPLAKIEFVYADPTSPFYLGKAKWIAALKKPTPIAFDAALSPLGVAARFVAVADKNKAILQAQYDTLVSKGPPKKFDRYRGAALYSDPDCATPVLAFMASQHTDLVTSLLGTSALSPLDGLSGFLAQGAARHPAEVEEALRSEMVRRAPIYHDLLKWAFTDNPLNLAGPMLSLDASVRDPNPGLIRTDDGKFKFHFWDLVYPLYTVETVQETLQRMIDERMAEEWAQENMLALKGDLEKANDDPGKYRRVLNRPEVADMHLTFWPPKDKKDKSFGLVNKYYNRYDIADAVEFKVLKDSYLKYLDIINLFEGRDMSPAGVLKPSDYPKMFFDQPESFSVASSLYRAMPWPPEVSAKARTTELVNPRLRDQLAPTDIKRFENHIGGNDPNREPPKLDLFKTAGRPILFWRTAEILANRPNNYDKIVKDIEESRAERTKIEAELVKNPKNGLLLSKKTELEQTEADLKTLQNRIVQGWKAEQARKLALPEAKKAAEKVLVYPGKFDVGLEKAADQLKTELNQKNVSLIALPKLSQWQPEKFEGLGTDYGSPQLKDQRIKYPREDMMKQLLSLYDLPSEIKTVVPNQDLTSKVKVGDADLDAINKELFEKAAKAAPGGRGTFVQILANKPRTIYYVAAVTQAPKLDERQFAEAMRGADFPRDFDPKLLAMHDHFAERAQEEQAKLYRREFIEALRRDHKVEIVNPDASKKFDEHGGND